MAARRGDGALALAVGTAGQQAGAIRVPAATPRRKGPAGTGQQALTGVGQQGRFELLDEGSQSHCAPSQWRRKTAMSCSRQVRVLAPVTAVSWV